jgi:PAS domain S-box-containing protein
MYFWRKAQKYVTLVFMSDNQQFKGSLPLETVLSTLVSQLDTISSSELTPDVANALAELKHHLQNENQPALSRWLQRGEEIQYQYDALLKFIVNAYVTTDMKLRIVDVNDTACQLWGKSPNDLAGSSLESFFPAEEQEILHSKVRQLYQSDSFVQEWESVALSITGTRPILIKLGIIKNAAQEDTGFRWLIRDISRRKQTNARLQRTYKLLLALVEASPKGIMMVDTQGRVQLWSDAAERILGWAQEEVLGQLPKHLPRHSIEQWLAQSDLITGEGRHDEVEMTCRHKDGSPVLLRLVTAALRSPEGQIAGWLQLFTDITKQHKMRAELLQMKARLASSREAEQRRLARGLHDDVIQQLIALQMDLATHRRQAEQSQNGAVLTGAEIAQNLARFEAQVVATVRELRGVLRELRPAGLEEYGLVPALDGFLNQLSRQYPERQLHIQKQWPRTPLEIPIDIATCLFKVAQEAIRNIIRHTTAQNVDILLEQSNSHTMMVIRDNGEGFAKKPKFTQLAHKGHFGLVGMLERVELVGGQLDIESTPGHGATILVRIPRAVEE